MLATADYPRGMNAEIVSFCSIKNSCDFSIKTLQTINVQMTTGKKVHTSDEKITI
jgi:hypothetical protein